MNYFMFMESFGSSSAQDTFGIVLLLAAPVLLLVALIFFIASIVKKNKKAKMVKIATINFISAGISALVGLGQCGWL